MRFYKNNFGMIKPFKILNSDGTAKDLTGLTITWKFKDRDGTVSSLTGSITSASTGQVSFTITSSFFTSVTRYRCQLHLVDGSAYTEDTDPFYVDIDDTSSA